MVAVALIDWRELRLLQTLWLRQAWPFRVIAWLRLRAQPRRDKSVDPAIQWLLSEIARLEEESATAAEPRANLDTLAANKTAEQCEVTDGSPDDF